MAADGHWARPGILTLHDLGLRPLTSEYTAHAYSISLDSEPQRK